MAKQTLKNIFRLMEVATSDKPIQDQFVADLRVSIEKAKLSSGRKPSRSYKPSSMNCIRNMYFQMLGELPDQDRMGSSFIGILESGSDRHERLQAAISKMRETGIDCDYMDVAEYIKEKGFNHLEIVSKQGYETKLFHKDLSISFLCDGIIRYHGEYYIIEIKTETIHNWRDRQEISPDHINQGTAYATCFDINKIIFLYECRDTCDKKAFLLEVTDDMKMERIISPIMECDDYIRKIEIPPVPPNLSKKTCSYCNYKTSCNRAGK